MTCRQEKAFEMNTLYGPKSCSLLPLFPAFLVFRGGESGPRKKKKGNKRMEETSFHTLRLHRGALFYCSSLCATYYEEKKTTLLNTIRTSSGSRVKRERSIEGCIGIDKKLNDGSPYAAERARERSYNLKTDITAATTTIPNTTKRCGQTEPNDCFWGKWGRSARNIGTFMRSAFCRWMNKTICSVLFRAFMEARGLVIHQRKCRRNCGINCEGNWAGRKNC